MSLLKKLAGETAIYGVSSILSRLLNWVILTPYFTRVFSQGEYGIVSDLYTWIALLMVIFTYRMETAFFRFGSKEGEHNHSFSTASLSLLISTLGFVLLLVIFAQPIASWLKYPGKEHYVIWFTLILGLDALAAIPFAQLRLENRPIRFAMIKTLNILVNILLIFFFLQLCPVLIERGWTGVNQIYNENDRISYVFISNFLASAVVLLLLLPGYLRIRLVFDLLLWKRMVLYALPLIIAGIAGVVNQLIGVPMIKELASDDIAGNLRQAGIYSAATKIAVMMNLFIQAFNYAAEPFFFKNAGRTGSGHIYAQVAQAFALVGSLVFLGIVLYLDVLQYFLGPEFREGLGVVPVLLLANLFLGLFYNFSIWYKITDRTNIGGYLALAGSAITLAINIWFIPSIGYYAPAWASLACYGLMAMGSYWLGQHYHPIRYPMRKIFTYLVLALGGYALSQWFDRQWDPGLPATILIHSAILLCYLLVLFWMEKETIARFLPSVKKS